MKYHQSKNHSALGTDIRNIQFPEKDEDGKFPCPVCEKRSSARKNVVKHVKEVHLGILYTCQNCDYSSTNTSKIGQHYKSAHLGEKLNCKQCDFEANMPSQLYNHRKIKHNDNLAQENQEPIIAKNQEALEDSLNDEELLDPKNKSINTNKETYPLFKPWKPLDDDFAYNISCSHCSFQCKKKKDLDWHMQENHVSFDKNMLIPEFQRDGDRLYPCNSCSKRFDNKSHIRRHVKEVHLAILNKCQNCDYTTKQKQKLTYHFKSVHLGMTWDCDHCNFQGSYPDALYLHRKIHI